MNEPSNLLHVFTGLLLWLNCAACGHAAMVPQPRPAAELRPSALAEMSRAWEDDANGASLEELAAERALRRITDDASLREVRATRSGWAASDTR